jgi:hypothetical protein
VNRNDHHKGRARTICSSPSKDFADALGMSPEKGGPVLSFTPAAWRAFLDTITRDAF